MATYNKFDCFATDLLNKLHDLFGTAGAGADTCNVYLTNAAPVTTNTVYNTPADLGTANGYTATGVSTANVGTASTGTVTINGTNVTWTAAGGSIGPFRYIVFYNNTSGTKPLIAWWDYGSALTLLDTETLTVKFNNGGSNGTVFTLV